jgi:hypothetical protein
MSWFPKAYLSFAIVMISSFNGQAEATRAGEPAQSPRITVRFFNYAQLPAKTVNEAKDRVTLIYHRTGLEIDWAQCPVGEEDPSMYPACTEVWDTTHLFLRLLPVAQKTVKVEKVGESFLGPRIANIYCDRVRLQAESFQVSPERTLAHTVAHELGHLLLGSNSHSPSGIMTGKWSRQDLISISQFGLSFTTQQSDVIRAEVWKRMSQASSSQMSERFPR